MEAITSFEPEIVAAIIASVGAIIAAVVGAVVTWWLRGRREAPAGTTPPTTKHVDRDPEEYTDRIAFILQGLLVTVIVVLIASVIFWGIYRYRTIRSRLIGRWASQNKPDLVLEFAGDLLMATDNGSVRNVTCNRNLIGDIFVGGDRYGVEFLPGDVLVLAPKINDQLTRGREFDIRLAGKYRRLPDEE